MPEDVWYIATTDAVLTRKMKSVSTVNADKNGTYSQTNIELERERRLVMEKGTAASPETRSKMSEAAKRRWAKFHAAERNATGGELSVLLDEFTDDELMRFVRLINDYRREKFRAGFRRIMAEARA